MTSNQDQKQTFTSQTRKITGFVLIFAFLVGLVYANQPATAASVIIRDSLLTPAAANFSLSVKPVTVTVVSLPAPKAVKVLSSSLALSCVAASANSSASVVQDEGLINLNQPANCFSLQSVTQAVAVQTLKVENLNQTAKINIAYSRDRWEPFNLSPSPLAAGTLPSLPALPLTLAAAVLVFRKKIVVKLFSLNNQARPNFSLHQLQVLRC